MFYDDFKTASSLTDFIADKFSKSFSSLGSLQRPVSLASMQAKIWQWSTPMFKYVWTVKDAVIIENSTFFTAFVLRRLQYRIRGVSTELKVVFHGTPTHNVESILQMNFNRRLIRRTRYGPGVSFALDTNYVAYCTNRKSTKITVFICYVIVGNIVQKSRDCDTTKIAIDTGHGGHVYVKARDDEFLPVYAVNCQN